MLWQKMRGVEFPTIFVGQIPDMDWAWADVRAGYKKETAPAHARTQHTSASLR